jgi:hypothetical protein
MGGWDQAQYVCCLNCISRGGTETLIDANGIAFISILDQIHIHPDALSLLPAPAPPLAPTLANPPTIHDSSLLFGAFAKVGAKVVATSTGTASDTLSSTSTGDKIISGRGLLPIETVSRSPDNLAYLTGYPGLPYAGRIQVDISGPTGPNNPPNGTHGIISDVFLANGHTARYNDNGTVNLAGSNIIIHQVTHSIDQTHTHYQGVNAVIILQARGG